MARTCYVKTPPSRRSHPPARTNAGVGPSDSNGITVPTDPVCSEIPHLFSGQEFVPAFLSFFDAPDANHSDLVHPCERKSVHPTPHYVCEWCRIQASHHIFKTSPDKIGGKCIAMCVECGKKALQDLEKAAVKGKPAAQGTAETPGTGVLATMLRCRCGDGWFCWQCKEQVYEIASAKRDTEIEFRTGFKGAVEGEASALMEVKCRCGKEVEKEADTHRCAGCEGLILKPSKN